MAGWRSFPDSRELPSVWLRTVSIALKKLLRTETRGHLAWCSTHSLMLGKYLLVLLMFVSLLEDSVLQEGPRGLQQIFIQVPLRSVVKQSGLKN